MDTTVSTDVIRSYDMARLSSGEILTAYGNYDGSLCRMRLSFYPSAHAARTIDGTGYTKVTYETGAKIPGCEKVLDHPGEQHFIVHRSAIDSVYKTSDGIDKVPPEMREVCHSFIALLDRSCGLSAKQHGLTGSGLLGCMSGTSDLDWVIGANYDQSVREAILASQECVPELTFTLEHAHRKYDHFRGLNKEALESLFTHRWKHFRFRGVPISVTFVSPEARADHLLARPAYKERVYLRGTVQDEAGGYELPRVIPVSDGERSHRVFSWLFLYGGALRTGDAVEVMGTRAYLGDDEFILVESDDDFIRKT